MATQKKRLRAQVTVGHDADGTPIYKWANGRTKKELEANKEELRRAHINGAVAIRRDIFFGEYVTEWYRAYKEPYLSASSKANYRSTLNHYLFPVFGDKQMRAITALQLQSYLNSLAGTGKTTLCYIMIILTNCFTLATAQGVIDRNAAAGLKPPKAERTSRRALTAQETPIRMGYCWRSYTIPAFAEARRWGFAGRTSTLPRAACASSGTSTSLPAMSAPSRRKPPCAPYPCRTSSCFCSRSTARSATATSSARSERASSGRNLPLCGDGDFCKPLFSMPRATSRTTAPAQS